MCEACILILRFKETIILVVCVQICDVSLVMQNDKQLNITFHMCIIPLTQSHCTQQKNGQP